ncbi:extracellular solute-binding protein [Marinilactibacillus sp. GCM10026970]|uniref:extracellular solute-binding protein n=1 Tax=Marinilactibacillus sp. GCM10026970 TaxID=3252642 RepID=UPI003607AB44
METKKLFMYGVMSGLTLSVLAGCGGGSGSEGGASENGGDSSQLQAVFLKHPLTKDINEMQWLNEAEETAGVDINWEQVTADWDQKVGPMLSAGDLPDLIVGAGGINDSQHQQFKGMFIDFSEHLDQLPNVQQLFENKPEAEALATTLDGEIFGLPKYQRFWPTSATKQFINQDWLDNLGLEMPTTWDELHEVLLAFKEQDANGNGDPNDEIPFDWSPVGTGGFGFFQPTVLLASTGITPVGGGGQGYFLEDGEVKNFFTDERYKEFMVFMNKLYADGLINSEVFTQEYTAYQSLGRGEGDVGKIGYTFGWEASDRFGSELAGQYSSMAPLRVSEDYDSDPSWSYDFYNLNYGTNMIQIAADTENLDGALAFVNELYAEETSMQVLFGDLGTNIEDKGDGSYAVLPPEDESMDPGTWKWTSTWADNGPMYIRDDLDLELGEDMSATLEQLEPLDATLEAIDTEQDVLPGSFLKYTTDDINTMSLNNTDMINTAITYFGQWITEGGVEEQWDQYVSEIEGSGIDQTLEIMQEAYDNYSN